MRLSFCLTFLLWSVMVSSQKLTVESFSVAQGDLSASVNARNDRNGVACGLVKVQLAATGAEFEGSVVGGVSYKLSEYWVYMNQGAYLLQVRCPGFLPLDINLHDQGLKDGVQPKVTYKLVLTKSQDFAFNENTEGNYVVMSVHPVSSTVIIDDTQKSVSDDGTVKSFLLNGPHNYSVSAPGYATKRGVLRMNGKRIEETVRLESEMATLRVVCSTSGAEIYIDDQLKGASPWSGQLAKGTYHIEARKKGFRSQTQSVNLSGSENRTVELPALSAQAGSLNVDYNPANAGIYVDGKLLGKTPELFRDIPLGRHEVEIRKEGYVPKKETVTVAEGQTASLAGTLTAVQGGGSGNAATSGTAAAGGIERFTVNGISFNMVRVEGGTFRMGSYGNEAEKPVHKVTLRSYSIGEAEVTQELWEAVMGKSPSRFKGKDLPVEQVSWDDCQEFIRRLNEKTGRTFRLPTEAEWEFAARGGNRGKGYKYSGSDNIGGVAWYWENSGDKPLSGEWGSDKINKKHCRTHPVKTKQANELGLYDMTGNVWEWCQDWYGSYSSTPQTNPTGPSKGSYRVWRGGSWLDDARDCRSTHRNCITPSVSGYYLGLRLAL